MTQGTILVVEDNPFTRRMVKVALEKRGYSVFDAEDGTTAVKLFESSKPDLVLQDLVLPDFDGFELIARLRALPRGDRIPILAFSGLVSKVEEARIATVGFDDVIVKPIEPSRLVPILEGHLLAPGASERVGKGFRVVLVDDDPIQLKLTRFRLERQGFSVEATTDGREALELARRSLPDGIVADVLMPGLDGFGLALAARRDPALAGLPVLLVTSSYIDESDRGLARRVGANDLIVRTPDHRELVDSLRRLLNEPRSTVRTEPTEIPGLEAERTGRVVHQLERQVTLNSGLARRCSALAAELTVLAGISEAVVRHEDIGQALNEAIAACFDVGGISVGALYLVQPDGSLQVRSIAGAGIPAADVLEGFFGEETILRSAIASNEVTFIPSEPLPRAQADDILRQCEATFGLLAPLPRRERSAGALFMAIRAEDFNREDWRVFAQGIAGQIAQALSLAAAFAEKDEAERIARDQAELLRASEERFRATFEQAAVGVAQVGPDGRWLAVNKRLCDIVGYSRAELLERTFQDITFPADLEVDLDLMRKVLSGELKTYTLEKRYIKKDGTLVWIDLTVSLVRDEAGPKYFVSVIQDISARKKAEAELERTSAQLRHAQRMEAIGRLAGGVAHDFNNVLSVITGYTELVLEELRVGDPMRDDVERVLVASRMGANLTRQLLAFSRQQVLAPRIIDPNEVFSGVRDMLLRLIGEDVELVMHLRSRGRVLVDPGQLEQVLMNLVVNARDAMHRGGKLTIETADVELDTEYAKAHLGVEPGAHVMFSVSDTGIGMDAATRARIFEPFFTTKAEGKGTGLGLSTAFGIVEQSAGTIWVYSEPEQGTTFKVFLPQGASAKAVSVPPPAPAGEARCTETILLVEDDEQVRALTGRILRRQGYRVLDAPSGDRALAISERHAGPIHLLLTDVVMPRMSGRELAEKLTQDRRDTKVLFVSGYTDDAVVHHGVLSSEMAFVQKPIVLSSFVAKVREVLDS